MNSAKPSGVSDASDAVKFHMVPAKPAGFSVDGGDAQSTLSWTNPNNSTIAEWQARQRAGNLPDFVIGTGDSIKVTFNWTDPGNSSITKWQIRSKVGSNDWGNWTDISNSNATTTSHSFTAPLTDGTHYMYQVRGYISSNNAVAATDLKIWETISTDATTTLHTVTHLHNGIAYKFRLRAVNATGPGPASAEKTSTMYPAAPANLVAEPGDTVVVLTWDDPVDSSITKYQYQHDGGTWDGYI